MATRSYIGVEVGEARVEPKKIKAVYCHYDGYPEGVGQKLLDYYNSYDKAKSLIALGNISTLGRSIGKKHEFNLSYDEKEKLGYTTFYGRDRGETGQGAITYNNMNQYMAQAKDGWIEFVYLWDKNKKRWKFGDTYDESWLWLKGKQELEVAEGSYVQKYGSAYKLDSEGCLMYSPILRSGEVEGEWDYVSFLAFTPLELKDFKKTLKQHFKKDFKICN